MKTVRTAVIGVGHLGRWHADKFAALPESELIAVCDSDGARAAEIAAPLGVEAVTDYRSLIGRVDAVSIVVPTTWHHEVAKWFLEHDVHVLLEKPITTTVEQADELIAIARARGCVLQVGHLERFNAAIQALDTVLEQPLFIESHRLAPFKPRGTDVSVVLDLMIHDIDIILDIVGSRIERIDANGASILSGETDIANARIRFENGCVANVTASRVSMHSERRMRLFQHDSYLSVDFQDRVLKVCRKGEREMVPGVPEIACEEQAFDNNDALLVEARAFLHAIQTGSEPVVSGEDGRRALQTAMEIGRLLNENLPESMR